MSTSQLWNINPIPFQVVRARLYVAAVAVVSAVLCWCVVLVYVGVFVSAVL